VGTKTDALTFVVSDPGCVYKVAGAGVYIVVIPGLKRETGGTQFVGLG